MHGAGHQPGAHGFEQVVEAVYFGLEIGSKRFERGIGTDVLDLDQVQHDLVGPAKAAAHGFRSFPPGGSQQQGVGNRHDRKRLPVHDHVFQLDAVACKRMQRGGGFHQAFTRLRASMRRTNEPMISR